MITSPRSDRYPPARQGISPFSWLSKEEPAIADGTELDDVLLVLPGFLVLAVTEDGAELLVGIETIRQTAGCPACGVIARTRDRLWVVVTDLPAFNRRVRLVWS